MWPCFQGCFRNGKSVQIGVKGLRTQGFHERESLEASDDLYDVVNWEKMVETPHVPKSEEMNQYEDISIGPASNYFDKPFNPVNEESQFQYLFSEPKPTGNNDRDSEDQDRKRQRHMNDDWLL